MDRLQGSAWQPGAEYIAEPSPRSNPERELMGAWRIKRRDTGRVVARFTVDGRDACERWAHRTGRHIS